MQFTIRMGFPEIVNFWDGLVERSANRSISKVEAILFKKFGKAFYYLSNNPKHPSLHSHEIESL